MVELAAFVFLCLVCAGLSSIPSPKRLYEQQRRIEKAIEEAQEKRAARENARWRADFLASIADWSKEDQEAVLKNMSWTEQDPSPKQAVSADTSPAYYAGKRWRLRLKSWGWL